MRLITSSLNARKYSFIILAFGFPLIFLACMAFSKASVSNFPEVNSYKLGRVSTKQIKPESICNVVVTNDCGAGSSISSIVVIGTSFNDQTFHLINKSLNLGPHSSYVFPTQVATFNNFSSSSFFEATLSSWGPDCIVQIFGGSSTNYLQDNLLSAEAVSPNSQGEFYFGTNWGGYQVFDYYVVVIEPQA